jgi:hypothetical protein
MCCQRNMKLGMECRHVWFIADTDEHSPTSYVLMSGHLGCFEGRNIVDAKHVHQLADPQKVFFHTLGVFVQHLFLTEQQQTVGGEKHERLASKKTEHPSPQRWQME